MIHYTKFSLNTAILFSVGNQYQILDITATSSKLLILTNLNIIVVNVESIRKIELHRHMEGCIDAVFLRSHLERFFPDDPLLESDQIEQLFTYQNFMDFLTSWGKVMSYLSDYEHFRFLARYVITQLKQENVRYAELIFSPQSFVMKGLELDRIFLIMFEEFKKSHQESRIIVDFVRNFGAQMMQDHLPLLVNAKKQHDELDHWLRAVSIGGDEVNYPAPQFGSAFTKARNAGFHIYAHAGEWLDASSVWDSINYLQVERIGHGINSVHDNQLLTYLKKHNIGLDISMTSNYMTNALASETTHPIGNIYDSGCAISINTDDPGFFHTNLNQEYQKFLELGYNLNDLQHIVSTSVENTFLTENEREGIRKLYPK